jgi:hypothetical protein
VVDAPASYRRLLTGTDGTQRHRELAWSAKAYVFHVGDNLSIWAERLAGALAGATALVVPYDEGRLAEVRSYERMPLEAALWSFEQAAVRWQDILERAIKREVGLVHPERGFITAGQIAIGNCHDVVHHEWDIRRF